MTTTTPAALALLDPGPRALLERAQPIVDRVTAMFAARPLTASPPVLVTARIAIDQTYSTPELALVIVADDPEGVYEYGCAVRITGSYDGSHLWVETLGSHRGQHATDDDAEAGAAFVFGLLLSALPDLEDD